MRQLFTILTLLIINVTVFGQYDIGLKANGGLSKISDSFTAPNTTTTVRFAPSGQFGFFYNLFISKKSIIGAELLFSQINGRKHENFPLHDSLGNPIYVSLVHNYYRHISYIGLPIQYGLKLRKLTINIGLQASFSFVNKERDEFYASYPKSTSHTTSNTYSKLYIDNYDFGARAGMVFNFTKKFAIDATYYYGINNIYKNNDYIWTVQQMTIGLQYKFFTTGQTNETENK